MGKFSDSFWRRTGHIAGNWAGYSIFGDKGADARRHIIQNARADAINKRETTRSRIANDHYINSVDAAVLRNVDAVIGSEFSDNPNELVKHLMDLIVQVKTNSFKARNAEEKVRTKYTYAVLAKLEQGVALLEYIAPMHPRLNYILWQYLKAKWRKIFSFRIAPSEDTKSFLFGVILLLVIIGLGVMAAYLEDGTHTFSELAIHALVYTLVTILCIIAIKFTILGLCMLYHRIKRNHYQKQILAYEAEIIAQETAKQKAEEEKKLKALETARLEAEANAKKKAEEDAISVNNVNSMRTEKRGGRSKVKSERGSREEGYRTGTEKKRGRESTPKNGRRG